MSYISNLKEKIISDGDKPLFEDAIKAADTGALRGAYILIWLACAESLKRKFKEATIRDSNASIITRDIETKESNHQSVDKFVLKKAKEYSLISDSEFQELDLIYNMRCVYGHPYEQAPDEEQLYYAASTTIRCVLSRPVRLKHGFAKQVIRSLLIHDDYLDDYYEAVKKFANDLTIKIDEEVYGYLLKEYWKELEKLSNDVSVSHLFNRGVWFSHAILEKEGVNVIEKESWHSLILSYPNTLMQICSHPSFFDAMSEQTKDTLISSILKPDIKNPIVLKKLENLHEKHFLNDRQSSRLDFFISELSIDTVQASELKTKTCYDWIIAKLKSRHWPFQNPTIAIIINNGASQISELTSQQQENLGRNILQCAEGNANYAKSFIITISEHPNLWPIDFLSGIFFEMFFNDSDQVRFKLKDIESVVKMVSNINQENKEKIIKEASGKISGGECRPSYELDKEIEKVIDKIKRYNEMIPVIESLERQLEIIKDKPDINLPLWDI